MPRRLASSAAMTSEDVEIISAVLFAGAFEDDEIEQDLALRREQRAEAGPVRRHLVEVAGDEIVEKCLGVFAGDPYDAPIGQDALKACPVSGGAAGAAPRRLPRPAPFRLRSRFKRSSIIGADGSASRDRSPWPRPSISSSRAAPWSTMTARAERDIGVRGGRIAAIGDLSRGRGRRAIDCRGPAHPARRHRHPGAFPRAGARPQGRSGDRLARRRPGRRHRRLRDAQHQPADHQRRRRSPTRSARGRHRMHCDFAFWVGGTHENAADVPRARAAAGRGRHQGVHGLLDRLPAGRGRRRRRRDPRADPPPRRLPLRGRAELRERARPARRGRSARRIRSGAAEVALRSTERLVAHRARDRRAHPRAAHLDRRGDGASSQDHKDVATVEATPHHLTLTAPTTMSGSAR